VSTDEASQALAVLEADQVAIRTAAALPRWYLLVASFCMGIIVVVLGIPEACSYAGAWSRRSSCMRSRAMPGRVGPGHVRDPQW